MENQASYMAGYLLFGVLEIPLLLEAAVSAAACLEAMGSRMKR
jgi:hypothetical protein